MPILKRFEVNQYLEDFEEIDEYSPLFSSSKEEEEIQLPEAVPQTTISLWEKCCSFLGLKIFKF
jgi:hypothetical protein